MSDTELVLEQALEDLQSLCGDLDPEPIAELAIELISLWTPPGSERPMAELVRRRLLDAGFDAEDIEIDEEFEGSPTVIARIAGGEPGPTLQWHAHTDAINIPHDPVIRDGDTVIGRGACDMKGGIAAMIHAAKLLKQAGLPQRGSVLITFHGLHEEGGSEPLHRLLERGVVGDAAISSELGSGLDLITGSRGLTFWEMEIKGSDKVLHETNAPEGLANPIEVASLLLNRLLALKTELESGEARPPGSLFVAKVCGGDYNNRFATTCELAGTRRHHAGTSLEEVDEQLRQLAAGVAEETGTNIEVYVHGLIDAYDIDADDAVARALRRAVFEVTGERMREVKSRASGNCGDFVLRAGIPAVYYGCDYSSAHSDREVLSVRQLGVLAATYALMTAYYLHDQIGDESVPALG